MVVGGHGTVMMMMMSSVILGPFGQYFGPLLIGSKRVAFPRLEALGFWLTPAAYVTLLSAAPRAFRRVPHRRDRIRAAGHPGPVGGGRVLLRVRPDGHLDDPGRLQHDRHRHQLPRPWHALEPAADVRLVDVHGVVPAGAGGAGAGRRVLHGPDRPDLPD